MTLTCSCLDPLRKISGERLKADLKDVGLNSVYEGEGERRVGVFVFFFNETKNTQEKDLQISRKIANYVSRRKSQEDIRKYACTRKFLTQD